MSIETLIAHLVQNYGAAGVTLALGIYALRALLPLLVAAVGHLGKIAEAMEKTALGVTVVDRKADQLIDESRDLQQKVAVMGALLERDRPTKPRRTMAATGD